jgi:hypothetical protein
VPVRELCGLFESAVVNVECALFGLTRQRFGLRIVPERSSKTLINVDEISIAVESESSRLTVCKLIPRANLRSLLARLSVIERLS